METHPEALTQIGRRRDSRLRLHIPARIVTIHGTFNAQLLNLSQSGAHLAVEERLLKGGDAVVFWLQYEAFGRIVRTTDKLVGLEFDDLVPSATLIATRDHADQVTAKDERRKVSEAARSWSQGYQ